MLVLRENQTEEKCYDDIFREKYNSIKKWSLQITGYNLELAEDIVHDVFLKLHQRKIVANTNNIDAYIYTSLKNQYQTKIRKNDLKDHISLTDNDFLADSTLQIDPRRQINVCDQLYAICQYACRRKDTSISGSILILKFFHGYYVSEIARLTRRQRNAVEARLLKARSELHQYLEVPEARKYTKRGKHRLSSATEQIQGRSDILSELRREIFSTRKGNCFSVEECREIYFQNKAHLNRQFLSHLVSCENCLNRTNKLLALPILSERDPLDFLRQKTAKYAPKFFTAMASFIYMFFFVGEMVD